MRTPLRQTRRTLPRSVASPHSHSPASPSPSSSSSRSPSPRKQLSLGETGPPPSLRLSPSAVPTAHTAPRASSPSVGTSIRSRVSMTSASALEELRRLRNSQPRASSTTQRLRGGVSPPRRGNALAGVAPHPSSRTTATQHCSSPAAAHHCCCGASMRLSIGNHTSGGRLTPPRQTLHRHVATAHCAPGTLTSLSPLPVVAPTPTRVRKRPPH